MLSSQVVPDKWDDWLNSLGITVGFCQSSQWSEINQAVNQKKPQYLMLKEPNKPKIGSLFFLSTTRDWKTPLRKLLRKKNGVLESHGGPIVSPESCLDDVARFLGYLDDYCAKHSIALVRICFSPFFTWQSDETFHAVLNEKGFKRKAWQTNIVDIKVNPEEQFSMWPHMLRKAIKKCDKEGIIVRRCQTKNELIEKFLKPFFDTRRELGYQVPSDIENHCWWDLDAQKSYNYFCSETADGKVLATLGTFRFNKVVTEIMSERTLIGREMKLPAQDFLHYKAFEYHHSQHDQYFDLAGFNPNPLDSKEAGIQKFKLKWPGQIYHCDVVEKQY